MIAGLRLLLLAAYLPLAHLAGAHQSPTLAVLALADLTLVFLIEGLSHGRLRSWLTLAAATAAMVAVARSSYALTPLLLVPPMFTAMISWWFARSLRPPRVPLITKVVAALYGETPETLTPRHRRYTRTLTGAWALLLALMTVLNLGLALIAVPDGVLARLGITAAVTVSGEQGALIANVANYGVLGLFMLIEYQWRKLVFPVRPYRNIVDFARRMAALGPAFWRDFFR